MPTIKTAVTIQAPREHVFARSIDIPSWPERIPAIQKVEVLTPGPVRVGTRFRETRIMFGKPATETMEIVSLRPPESWASAAESHGCRYHSELRFTPEAGGTRVEMVFTGTGTTLFRKVMGVLLRPLLGMMLKMCAKDLEALKRSCEQQAAGAGG